MIWLTLLLSLAASAQQYRAPFGDADYGHFYPTAYYDHGGRDWACGTIRYSGHTGSDYGVGSWPGMDAGRDVVAAAGGVVTYTNDGEFDRCSTGNCSGGSGGGNYVNITHPSGRRTQYLHLKTWSVRVSAGQTVTCGQKLGEVGSSGWSTGPHLHFTTRDTAGNKLDPFQGGCDGAPNYWVSQGSHGGRPSATCEVTTVDNDGDGHHNNTDCNDNDASVHPGATEICNDGKDNDCTGGDGSAQTWYRDNDGDGFGGESVTICQTSTSGLVQTAGDCDDSTAAAQPGKPELCDGIDNDCNDIIDDGRPTEMGTPAPTRAAVLIDASLPGSLAVGEQGEAWFVFENVGTEAWAPGDLWLRASPYAESPLRHEEWPAWDVVAVLDEAVPPGETGALRAVLRASDVGMLTDTLTLTMPDGTPVRCPVGEVDVMVNVPVEAETSAQLGCASVPGSAWWFLPSLLLIRRRS